MQLRDAAIWHLAELAVPAAWRLIVAIAIYGWVATDKNIYGNGMLLPVVILGGQCRFPYQFLTFGTKKPSVTVPPKSPEASCDTEHWSHVNCYECIVMTIGVVLIYCIPWVSISMGYSHRRSTGRSSLRSKVGIWGPLQVVWDLAVRFTQKLFRMTCKDCRHCRHSD